VSDNDIINGARLTVDNLRADAARVLANLDWCWTPAAQVRHLADILLRLHPGIDREQAIVACEQALWAGWP
jgi:hypothetical protein